MIEPSKATNASLRTKYDVLLMAKWHNFSLNINSTTKLMCAGGLCYWLSRFLIQCAYIGYARLVLSTSF